MLKARDIAYEIESFLSTDQGEAKIKEYARQCVLESIKAAVIKLNEFCEDHEGLRIDLQEIIESAPIETP